MCSSSHSKDQQTEERKGSRKANGNQSPEKGLVEGTITNSPSHSHRHSS